MKRFPFPLRFSIPATLLLLSGISGLFSFQREISLSNIRTEEDASRQARFSGDQTSGTLEYLFRKGDVEGANLVISKLGGNSTLRLGTLSDENDKIILSTRYELRNQLIVKAEASNYSLISQKVRQAMSGQVVLSENKQNVQAIYPVILGSVPGELRPTKMGILLLQYDLSELKQRSFSDALRRSLEANLILALLCFAVWLFFYKTLTQRAARLVRASNYLSEGHLHTRTALYGSDELAQISLAFDQMATKVQNNQQELQELVERRELLNHLASQIRTSLELDVVLSTAVNEIRALFKIARCKFLWCWVDNDLLKFELVYEACKPQCSDKLSHYPIQEIETLKQAILTFDILQIDDVSTDPQLDSESQALLTSLGFTSLLITSLRTRSGRSGVIICEHGNESRVWANSEVELLQSVADQLVIAIDQAELYEQSRTAVAISESKTEQLSQALKDLQQTQTQLIQTEKMSSLGQLVAGVAHEINNPVNFIYGNIVHASHYTQDLLSLVSLYQQCYSNPDPKIQALVEEIDLEFLIEDLPKMLSSMKVGADRIRQIVLTLRNFSRLDEAEMKPVNVHEGIDSTLLILQNQLKEKSDQPAIQVIKQYSDLPDVECYAGQLNQVFMNIISNAIDALHESNARRSPQCLQNRPSTITISTHTYAADWIDICIKDNGSGMLDTVREKLFDPFFTTKKVGEGTGLGLSISYQIVVKKHGGHLKCVSEPGEGAEFWIQIPVKHVH